MLILSSPLPSPLPLPLPPPPPLAQLVDSTPADEDDKDKNNKGENSKGEDKSSEEPIEVKDINEGMPLPPLLARFTSI